MIRQKILRFLMDGEQWVNDSMEISGNAALSRSWREQEHALIQVANECMYSCNKTLLGNAKDDHSTEEHGYEFDIDGAGYLDSLLSISEKGTKYISNSEAGNHPIQPIKQCLDTLRKCLDVVGFSEKTTKAGLTQQYNNDADITGMDEYNKKIINEMVRFRSLIRSKALGQVKGENTDVAKEILSLCDEMRDERLPSLGLELSDVDIGSHSNSSHGWRYNLSLRDEIQKSKRSNNDKQENKAASIHQRINRSDVNKENFFQLGQYEGLYADFDDDYLPVKNVDGSEVSKNQRKKLLKKREKFFKKK